MPKKILVTGISSIDDNLKRLEANMSKKIIRKVLRAELKDLAKEAKQNLPKSDGDLRKGTKVKGGKRSSVAINMNVMGTAPHALHVEYGQAKRGVAPDGTFRKLYDLKKDSAAKKVIDEISKAIQKEIC